MNKTILAVLLAAVPAAAQRPSADALRLGCGFDGAACSAPPPAVAASGGESDRYIRETIDERSGLRGELLEKTREGENRLLQRTIDESPALSAMIRDSERRPTWRECYDRRITDAAVASWSSNVRAGYLKGTAAAYATYETAPGLVAVVGGGVLWIAGVVYGLGLTAIGIAATGHL
jgi:hypothetical protein